MTFNELNIRSNVLILCQPNILAVDPMVSARCHRKERQAPSSVAMQDQLPRPSARPGVTLGGRAGVTLGGRAGQSRASQSRAGQSHASKNRASQSRANPSLTKRGGSPPGAVASCLLAVVSCYFFTTIAIFMMLYDRANVPQSTQY